MPETLRAISDDGTLIAARRSGAGSQLVLVHGTGGSAARWSGISSALEKHFTVYAVDRRGRGMSGDRPDYAIEREVEDLVAFLSSLDGPLSLLGHSYGGICSLEAALQVRSLRRLILYEPPIPVEGVPIYPSGAIERLEALLDAGDREGVVMTFMREVVRMPPPELELLRSSPAWPGRVAAAHTLPRELRAHERYRFRPERFRDLAVPTLLLLGGESPAFFRAAISTLEASLPNARVEILEGQQHIAMDTAPAAFVRAVVAFLTDAE